MIIIYSNELVCNILNYINNKYADLYEEYINIYDRKNKDYWINLSNDIKNYCEENNIKYINYFYHEGIRKNK